MVREKEMNTLSFEFMEELDRVFDEVRWDPGCRVVILTGQGRVFSAGAELKTVIRRDAVSVVEYLEKVINLFDKLEGLPQATIAAINGYALGGGCEMALACDFRIMSDEAKIGVPEVKLGALPAAGGVQRLPRLIGKARATEMVLLGRHLTAEEAERFGLLYKRVPSERLIDEALTLAEELSQLSPVAIYLAKSCLAAACDADLRTSNQYALRAMALCFAAKDQEEGMRAFFEKRQPAFPGFMPYFGRRGSEGANE
jgi:enoyl-CoA hydratase/carnithine racemase